MVTAVPGGKNTGELLPAPGGAEGTQERVLALHTEMCEKSGVTSVEEGHDVESDVAEETMSAVVKLAKAICELYDIGQPTAECQFRGLPGESWLHVEASSCPCRVEQKTVSSHTEMCKKGEVTSGEEGHDVERVIVRSDVVKDTMSATRKCLTSSTSASLLRNAC